MNSVASPANDTAPTLELPALFQRQAMPVPMGIMGPNGVPMAYTGITTHQFVSMRAAGQLFGMSVLVVQDVLRPQRITQIPLAPPWVAGALNLRGRIVTAIDVYQRLGLPTRQPRQKCMNVVVEYKGELYSLLVESVGEVLTVPLRDLERNPSNMAANWQEVSAGVYRLEGELMIVLDVARMLRSHDEASRMEEV